jgi:hypothetical protein
MRSVDDASIVNIDSHGSFKKLVEVVALLNQLERDADKK